MVKKETHV